MSDHLLTHYAYWLTSVLLCIGLYGMLAKRNLVKKLIGLGILQASIILFFVAVASKPGATVPVRDAALSTDNTMHYLNPLPHTLMLTAIVVGVATLGVGFTLLIAIYNRYRTLEEDRIIDEVP
jgi:multicomponent Na+:H+ antiporter subunit C